MKSIYSFDIFDTILTRTVLNPKDVFSLVQARIPSVLPDLPPRFSAAFRGMRIWSEFLSRRHISAEDVTLTDIYVQLSNMYRLNYYQQEQLARLELSLESEVLVPVNGAAALINMSRDKSGSIVFISDMYLPSAFIRNVMERFGLFMPGDRLYVSGELGRTKGTGELFKWILQDLGILPENLIHYGDHPRSDYFVPKSLGIGILNEAVFQHEHSFIAGMKANGVYLKELIAARIQIFGARNV